MSAGRILVVDDDRELRAMVAQFLTDVGYTVEGAPDGPAALRIIEGARPDLILLDIHLPGVDGRAVARSLREGQSGIPVVAMSALPDDETELSGGLVDSYLRKPFDLDELLTTVERFCPMVAFAC
jgi:DNA-binding response OmpR family regulator